MKRLDSIIHYFKYTHPIIYLFPPILVVFFLLGVFLLFNGMATIYGVADRLDEAAAQEQAQWQKFNSTHNCQVIEKKQAIFPAVAQVAWACDDGITYWRNDQ